MKIVPVMAFLSVSVMVVMIYQAVRQELELRSLKARMLESSTELKQKEHAIIQEKNKIQDLNKLLEPLTKQKDELNKKKLDISRSVAQMTNSLVLCNTDKVRKTPTLRLTLWLISCHRTYFDTEKCYTKDWSGLGKEE